MQYHTVDEQSQAGPAFAVVQTQHPRGHKRRRSNTIGSPASDACSSSAGVESCCSTSGESSADESDSFETEVEVDEEEEEALAAAKRRRRADLDKLKKSVRLMEAQVVDASAQLRDLAALVAQAMAQRQRLQQA
ncbi:unnamed protein product [Phytophthora fragariaefolia]|uniref:Unnamed protein product n=1 Tax=Phytophthora fragariaefolia TaxID=1490495 RepID=A0A9W7CS77_9STRA|nr:unnamed protein product [Phytophthora fragariaefolia]